MQEGEREGKENSISINSEIQYSQMDRFLPIMIYFESTCPTSWTRRRFQAVHQFISFSLVCKNHGLELAEVGEGQKESKMSPNLSFLSQLCLERPHIKSSDSFI